jgi:hypothetical protein
VQHNTLTACIGRALSCACLLVFAANLAQAAGGATAEATLLTDDTRAHVEVRGNRLLLTGLQYRNSQWDWIDDRADNGGTAPVSAPFVETALVDGRPVTLTWKYAGSSLIEGVPRRHVFSFVCTPVPLELKSIWSDSAGPGPIEHAIAITNRSQSQIELPLQTSLTFAARMPAEHRYENWWVEKGATKPTATGTHRNAISSLYAADLVSLPYSRDGDSDRDAIPWTAIQDIDGGEGWYAGVEFSGRVHIGLKAGTSGNGRNLTLDAGLLPEETNAPAYRTHLAPGATFETPTVFLGCYRGDLDAGVNRLHRWVENAIRPPIHDPNVPLLVSNTWGAQTDINASLVRAMTDDAAALGLEMIHVDAGWYRGVGDWVPDTAKFPDGLAPLADYAHSKRLKFGLWVGWTQGGIGKARPGEPSPLSVEDPAMRDWFAHDPPPHWKPEPFTGADICLGDPRAVAWCRNTLERLVSDYHLDLLEHDQRIIVDSCTRTDHLHTDSATDTAYQATRGYYQVYDGLRIRRPTLLLEDCVNGGHTVDYGILRRTHYVSITDTYDPLSNRRAFYDASYALPPSMCECYIANQPCKSLDEFRAMLRSGMMGWCTVMCDTTHWTREQHEAAKRQFAIYKTWLRPLIAAGDLYHITDRPDGAGWDGMEYYHPQSGHGVVFAFRGTGDDKESRFICKGLERDLRYKITFEDGTGQTAVRTGADLMTAGIEVRLNAPQTSELVYLERVAGS